MKAIFLSFARGVATMDPRKWVMEVEGVKTRAQASKLCGTKVLWMSSGGKRIVGNIVSAHGDNGHIMANFKKGPPHTVRGHKATVLVQPQGPTNRKGKAAKAAAPAAKKK